MFHMKGIDATWRENRKILITVYVIYWIALPVGRPRLRWMDQLEDDLKRMKIVGWRAKVEDIQEWNRIVEQTKTHPGL